MANNPTPSTENPEINPEIEERDVEELDIEERTVNGQTVLWSKSLGGPVSFLTDEHVKAEVRQTFLPPVAQPTIVEESPVEESPAVEPEAETENPPADNPPAEAEVTPTEATPEVTPEVIPVDGG